MKLRKLVALLLSAVMLFGMLPAAVYADDAATKIDLTDKTKTGGSSYKGQNPFGNAFDANTSTFFDGDQKSWCQVDLGAVYDITKISCYPRDGRVSGKNVSEYVQRMNGSKLYGSINGSDWTELYTYTGLTTEKADESAIKWYDAALPNPCSYRYVKWGNDTTPANLAEIEIYGTVAAVQPDPVPTPTPEPTPTPDPAMQYFQKQDRAGWSASTNSQQATSGGNSVGMILDGKADTIWHSSWTNGDAFHPDTNPIYVVVDMGKVIGDISMIEYTPRIKKAGEAGSVNGVITAYEVYASSKSKEDTADGDWTKIAEGNLGYTKDDEAQNPKNIIFSPTDARCLKLVVKDNLEKDNAYRGSCAEFNAYTWTQETMTEHPITAALAKLDAKLTTLNALTTTHSLKAKLLEKANELKTSGSVDGIESFIAASERLIDALSWVDEGIDDVYIGRLLDMLSEANISASALATVNNELAGFYALGSDVKESRAAAWQGEFTMSAEEETQPLYTRIKNAISRVKKRIEDHPDTDYIMLKELVSYISGKYDYEGYENPFGMNAERCEAVVNNINFTLSNLEKIDAGTLSTTLTSFRSGEIWLDTLGSKISAHGGQIIQKGDTYYWYGEDNKIAYDLTTGVSCYSSKNLMDWKYEGLAFKAFDDGTAAKQFTKEFVTDSLQGTKGRIERPKVIYNKKNDNYVMWMHLEKDGGYGLSVAGVATASSPTGPFVWQWYGLPVYDTYVVNRTRNRTDEITFRDMNLFVDDDDKAYVFYSSESNQVMYAVQLNSDYTWINDEGLTQVPGESADGIDQNSVIIPDMTKVKTADYTYGKTSFTRYQLASGGGMSLMVRREGDKENGTEVNDDGTRQYVSQRKDYKFSIPEYPETGRWARVGQYAAPENKDKGSESEKYTTVNNITQNQREAPAPIKIGGKYYMITSALSGWKANPSLTQTADSILGTWTPTGNPMTGEGPANNGQWSHNADTGTSFNSQSTCILPLPNGQYMYMGDRWKNGVYQATETLEDVVDVKASTYVWLPITFETDSKYGENTMKVRWKDAWSYDNIEQVKADLTIHGTEPYVLGNLYLPTQIDGVTISWASDNTAAITADGVVTRGASDVQVTLTATLSCDGKTDTKTFPVTVKQQAVQTQKDKYLFVHFKDGSEDQAEQIYFSVSQDGMNWEKLNASKPIITSTLGTKGLRDPHIVRSPEGDKFFMIATDLKMNGTGLSWAQASSAGSKSIMIWESTDLVHWSDQRMATIAPDGAGCAWAPESIYDSDKGAYMVYWASKTDGKQKIYYSETRDFVNFTAPQVYLEKTKDVIDSTIVEDGGTYYRFSKDETDKNVIMESSNSLHGEFAAVSGYTPIAECEGPTCFKRADGKWCLMVDFYASSGYRAYVADTLAGGGFTEASGEYKTPYTFRHGTVIPITTEEYNAIKEAYTPEVIYGDSNTGPAAVQIPAQAQDTPVLWYDFENIKNGVIPDKSGNNNHGALIDGGEYTENEKIGKGVLLDTAGYIRLPDNIMQNTEDFTLSMWINTQERGSGIHNKTLVDFGGKIQYVPQGNKQRNYSMFTKFGSKEIVSGKGTQLAMNNQSETTKKIWSHLTIVKSGQTLSMYVNGALDTTGSIAETTASLGTLNGNYIGKNITLNIDEVKLYNKALSPAETLVQGAAGLSDADGAQFIHDGLTLEDTTGLTESITLPVYPDILSWKSSNASVITDNGVITRPAHGKATATLTATIKVGAATLTKAFAVSVNGMDSYDYTLNITNEKGVDIQDTMFGLFFEDINYAADGGLYAEMIENRSFEAMKNKGGKNIEFDGQYAWSAYPDSSGAVLSIADTGGLNEKNTHYLSLTTSAAQAGFKNQAYDGVYLQDKMTYHGSFYAKAEQYTGSVTVSVIKGDTVYASATIENITSDWAKYTFDLTANDSVDNADFIVTLSDAGTVCFDMISLIPDDAVEGIFRKDLAEKLKALNPGFLRFPGGCVIEGCDLNNRYNWKDSVGAVEQRKQNWNRWSSHTSSGPDGGYKHYNQTYGLGYYEYFKLCEYLECEPVPVQNAGMACQYQDGKNGGGTVPVYEADGETYTTEFQTYLDDALDLIEFANGDTSTEWGALRASMGHPEPFHLKFIGIGNEQWEIVNGSDGSNDWHTRYEAFEKEIHAQYPEIKLVGTAGPDVTSSNYTAAWNWIREKAASNPNFAAVVDEHYYMEPNWFYENDTFYDNYPRGVKVFAGEYASRGAGDNKPNYPQANTLLSAISEAAFMTGLERNADVVYMASYAPLFARVNYTQWSPDMIWFDGETSYATPSYYTQQMYANNTGDYTLKSSVTAEDSSTKLYQTVSYDEATGDVIVKLVNKYAKEQSVQIQLTGYTVGEKAAVTQLAGEDVSAYNSITEPDKITPQTSEISVSDAFRYTMAPNSFTVLRIPTAKTNAPSAVIDAFHVENGTASYTIHTANIPDNASVILAVYDNDNVLRKAIIDGDLTGTFETEPSEKYTAKLFVWELDKLKPVISNVSTKIYPQN